MQGLLSTLSQYMAEHNIPFYSPRYNGHMNADLSLPGTLGYMVTWLPVGFAFLANEMS